MVSQELVKQSNLIITSLMNRLNGSEEWMINDNFNLTFEEIEAFCSYYGVLPSKLDFDKLLSFHEKFRKFYKNSKTCITKISPYFSSDGELVSSFEASQASSNNGNYVTDSKVYLYSRAVEDLKHARNLEAVVFIYETFLKIDLKSNDEVLKQQIINIKREMDKVSSSIIKNGASQIENAKKTLSIISLNKEDDKFTESLKVQYFNISNLEG